MARFSKYPSAHMTRRGSIAYYLAAVVIGCFFLTTAYLLIQWRLWKHVAIDFLFVYFLSLASASLPPLVTAFALRRLSGRLHLTRRWQWAAAGMLLLSAAVAALGGLGLLTGDRASDGAAAAYPVFFFLSGSRYMLTEGAFWGALPAGAATGYVLFFVHRAFAPRPQSPAA